MEIIHLISSNQTAGEWLNFFNQHKFKVGEPVKERILNLEPTSDIDNRVAIISVNDPIRAKADAEIKNMNLETALLIAKKFITEPEFMKEAWRITIPFDEFQFEILRTSEWIVEGYRKASSGAGNFVAYLFGSEPKGAFVDKIINRVDQEKI